MDRCVAEIRAMILRGELLPGEKLRQSELADKLEVSRIPVREALKVLQGEWIVTHVPNVGFTVARFNAAHHDQVYLMRSLLEPELIRTLGNVDRTVIQDLRSANRRMAEAGRGGDYHAVVEINREFHFTIFSLSRLDIVRAEVKRLWDMSDFYRSLYVYDTSARERVLYEHERIIGALADGDIPNVLSTLQEHRDTSREHVEQLIRPRPVPVSQA